MRKFTIQGTGKEIKLDDKDFITSGGEGEIFGKGNTSYKIYFDASKMIPMQKYNELSVLKSNPNIIVPQEILLNKQNIPIGYTMPLLKDTHVLVSLFPKSFKQKNNLTNDKVLHLVKKLQEIISFIHSKNDIFIIDCNEYNFLIDNLFKTIYAIDTNSYQTPSFPATVLMDSVRDRHSKQFNQNTDWFSFGIVSFQMLIGQHPYKGGHPNFENLPKTDRMNARMLQNVSIFNKDATYPKVCESFDIIPPALRKWYQAIFDNGIRCPPPANYESEQVITNIIKTIASKMFNIKDMFKFPENIIDAYGIGNSLVAISHKNIYYKKLVIPNKYPVKIGFEPKTIQPIAFWLDNGIQCLDIETNNINQLSIDADSLFSVDTRVYAKCGQNILELIPEKFNELKILTRSVGKVLDFPGATKIFDGFILQNVLGKYHLSFFPRSGECYQVKLNELTGHKIIDAKYQNQVLVIITSNKGKTNRLIFRFNQDFSAYDVTEFKDIDYNGINFTVNSQGICVLLNEEEKIEAFKNTIGASINVMHDPHMDTDIKFWSNGQILLISGNKICSFQKK